MLKFRKSSVEKDTILQNDILHYKKNKFAGNFALLALVFNCLYFTMLYAIHSADIYKPLIGLSVIVNLLVMLAGFFCSEGIKNYNKKFSIALFVLAAVQIVRIFVYPLTGMVDGWMQGNYYFGAQMSTAGNGVVLIIYLVASAACFIVAGINGLLVALRLEHFDKKLQSGEISVEKELAALDEAERTSSAGEVNNG